MLYQCVDRSFSSSWNLRCFVVGRFAVVTATPGSPSRRGSATDRAYRRATGRRAAGDLRRAPAAEGRAAARQSGDLQAGTRHAPGVRSGKALAAAREAGASCAEARPREKDEGHLQAVAGADVKPAI